ncbi:hypothetical protein BCR33DRAFT_362509 [Rhizoclosmatium globosum]|uniref:Uncharacterized protein n=1 Tax=Rhizoclosmatium globosum TaxID=329046 RepID=A0A1Y2C0E4_9FUNG|nr:hypothetical protein BCR33DRAFT_362509 [Rhizoclosmatium globosum]|eukprot:ORY40347.1 hypothetical protein BCR33DRAFT_362509 [Rhizoclosmatium globosum]
MEESSQMLVLANFGNHIADQIPQGKLAPGYDLPAFKNDEILNLIMQDYETKAIMAKLHSLRPKLHSHLRFPTNHHLPLPIHPHLPQPGPITPITPSAPEEIYSAPS